jgi:hypothetical protein
MSLQLTQHLIGDSNVSYVAAPLINVPNTTIVNRAKIRDLSQDMAPCMGIQRISAQQILEIQSEFGPNGERVFSVLNDDLGLIRFVGGWNRLVDQYGPYSQASTTNDYVEITFYGTGLNANMFLISANDARITVDGGTEGANILNATYSTVLGQRQYSANQVQSIVSGLSVGIHTVKIRSANAVGLAIYGFEILNESSTVRINSGRLIKDQRQVSLETAQSLAYKPSVLTGTKGGRVVTYNQGGVLAQAVQAVGISSLFLTSADHSAEELARVHNWREFGIGRADDFSTIAVANAGQRAFTLDDGVTSLAGANLYSSTQYGVNCLDYFDAATDWFVYLTFVGTGLDIALANFTAATSRVTNVTVDGVSVGSIPFVANSGIKNYKIASGLPYGTHVVRLSSPGLGGNQTPHKFISFSVYQPKKPAVPVGAIELADYNVMADFAPASTSTSSSQIDLGLIGTGTLRKMLWREAVYVGAWGINVGVSAAANIGGFEVGGTLLASNFMEYTFFGTGFEIRFEATSGSVGHTITLNGSNMTLANFPNLVTSQYGMTTTVPFNTSTGVFNTQGTTAGNSAGFSAKGLPLGKYTVRFTNISGGVVWFETLDIITPIHSSKSNLQADLQNSLPVGSCSLSDSRQLIPTNLNSAKACAQASGTESNPTTTSNNYVPMPQMSLALKTNGGKVLVNFVHWGAVNTIGALIYLQCYIDGVPAGPEVAFHTAYNANYTQTQSLSFIAFLSAGAHKIDVYWKTTGGVTASSSNTGRNLLAIEL